MEKQLPSATVLDTVTPATQLLEKRRLMYESQEKYKDKRKEYSTQEISFKIKERELREQDQDIQEQLVHFAAYLDVNQNTIKRSENNIAKLEQENAEKRELLRRQKIKKETFIKQKESIRREQLAA